MYSIVMVGLLCSALVHVFIYSCLTLQERLELWSCTHEEWQQWPFLVWKNDLNGSRHPNPPKLIVASNALQNKRTVRQSSHSTIPRNHKRRTFFADMKFVLNLHTLLKARAAGTNMPDSGIAERGIHNRRSPNWMVLGHLNIITGQL